MTTEAPEPVNPHYLDHVVATAQSHEVAASEDIVAGNGIKLIAKGTRIDAATRDRLLEHKLRKPLEDCMQVVDGVTAARLESVAEALLEKHPLLRALCATERARSVPASIAALTLSMPLQSLLTVYVGAEGRLEHTVGVAMLALSLARKLLPGDIGRHRLLATAGMVHDVGELYLDPAFMQKGTRLDSDKWRHIVTHPLVGHRVLRDMAGAGQVVANAVLLHHERLDGFGYPRNLSGDSFSSDGQIVAASEWLMALVESDSTPLTRARMAERLIPGEFSPALLAAVSAAARAAPDEPVELSSVPPLEEAVPRIVRLDDTLRRFDESRIWIGERIAESGGALRLVLEAGLQRTLRIQASFSSTGLDAHNAEELLRGIATQHDPDVYVEITTMVGELEWRMRELERSQRLRGSLLSPSELRVVTDLIGRLRGSPVEPTSSPG
jgi:HD domain